MAGKFNDCANGATPFPPEFGGEKRKDETNGRFSMVTINALSCFQCFVAADW